MLYLDTPATWQDAEERYDELLDTEGPVEVSGLPFNRSRVLRELDPIAYRCGLFDFIDGEGWDSDELDGDPSV